MAQVTTTAMAVGQCTYNGALLVGGSGAAYKWGNNNATWPLLLVHFGFITNAAGNRGYHGNPTGGKTAAHIYNWLVKHATPAQRGMAGYAKLALVDGAAYGLTGQTVLTLPTATPIAWLAAWVAAPINSGSNLALAYAACLAASKAFTPSKASGKGQGKASKGASVTPSAPQTLAQRAAATSAAIASAPVTGQALAETQAASGMVPQA